MGMLDWIFDKVSPVLDKMEEWEKGYKYYENNKEFLDKSQAEAIKHISEHNSMDKMREHQAIVKDLQNQYRR